MKRRVFLKSLGISGIILPHLSISTFGQQLPPLSPQHGGRSILPTALKVGDIILSTTSHLSSRIIRDQTDLPISHARIVYSTQNANNPELAEAVASGVHIISYQDMLKSDTLSVALRKEQFSNASIKTLQEWLLSKLGSDYDFGGVFEQWLRIKVKWMSKLHSVELGNPKKFYCSELVAEAYKAIGKDLLKYGAKHPDRNSTPGRFVEMTWFDDLEYVGHLKY